MSPEEEVLVLRSLVAKLVDGEKTRLDALGVLTTLDWSELSDGCDHQYDEVTLSDDELKVVQSIYQARGVEPDRSRWRP